MYPDEVITALRAQCTDPIRPEFPDYPFFKLGIVTKLELIGSFATGKWKEDPEMPDFLSYHNYELGIYRVADVEIFDGNDGTKKLTVVINDGDGDCNTGYWGAIFEQCDKKEIARIISSGDTETTIRAEVPNNYIICANIQPYEDDDGELQEFNGNLRPGHCQSNFERILGSGK